MTAKSPIARFDKFFGIKRRPSTNFQANNDTPPFYNGVTGAEDDPFAANVPSPVDSSNSRNFSRHASELEQGLGIDFSYQNLHDPPTSSRSSDRPPPIEVFRPSQADTADSAVEDHLRVPRKAGNNVIGKAPLTLGRGSSATSVESLALAAAIAHANGMVLSPDPSSTSIHSKSAATPEYPSPPPSDHSSPYPSGVSSNANRFFDEAEEHEDDEYGQSALLVVGSAGNSSLPTTPVLIDSFPTTPFGPIKAHAQPAPSSLMAALATEALPTRTSSRGTRQRAGSTPAAWTSSNAPYYNTADLDVWEEAEGSESNHNYPLYSLRTLPELGPPPVAPLPPEPLSPRLHSSGIYKHLHQLELDITSLTRKLTTTSTRSGSSHTGSLNPSTSDVPKMLKKSASQSRLQRESSGGTSGSSAASNSQGMSSASASTTAMPTYSTQSRMETALQNARRNRVMQAVPLVPPMPNLDYRPTSAQRPSTASAEPTLVSPLKLKDKDRRPTKEKEASKEERDKEGFSRRRFFSKYASMGSHMEKEPSAEISNMDLEDASSVASMHSGGTGLPDDEWGANLSLAISSSLQTTESSINILPVSSPSSQRSPMDDLSPAFSSPPSRSHMSPSEYVPQHILPPAEILRLERTGFVIDDPRGRDARLSGSSSKSPSSTSPGPSQFGRDRKETSTSRLDLGLHPVAKTRSQRSGSLAAVSPSSTGVPNAASSPQSRHHSGSVTAQILSGSPSPLPRKMSAGSIFPPTSSQKSITRPVTSPSSPADLGNALSLPPPPRPRIKSFRSSSDLEYAHETASITESTMSSGLPPPPRSIRRPSTASNASSTHTTLAQKHRSILRKPSFLDIGDEDGRLSLEEASEVAAPGASVAERHFADYLIAPSRSRSATVSSGWTSSTLSTSRPTSRPASRQHTPISSRQPTPTIRDTAAPDDSFLDMGKLSLDTIRSEDEDANPHAANPITITEPRAPQRSWHAMLPHKQMGSAF